MEKHKNSNRPNNNQLLVMGIGLLIILSVGGGILGTIVEFVAGIIGLVFGLVGAVIGLVFGLIGVVLGIVFGLIGTVLGLVFGTAIIWIPLLIIMASVKAMSNKETSEKKKHSIS